MCRHENTQWCDHGVEKVAKCIEMQINSSFWSEKVPYNYILICIMALSVMAKFDLIERRLATIE